jgi:predicted phosphodiesterase
MKIDFCSDIHLDFWVKEKDVSKLKFGIQLRDFIDNVLCPVKSDFEQSEILIIAGDLGHYNNQIKALFIELKKIYKEIIVTGGNHDLYLVSNGQVSKYDSLSISRIEEIKNFCIDNDIHYLDGNIIEIDGIKFGGTMSWYNLPTSQDLETWKKVMNDSQKIYSGFAPKSYDMYNTYSIPSHNWNTQKYWLDEKAKLIEIAKQGCDIFITHIALNEPTLDEGMHEEYYQDPHNIFYYTDNIGVLKQSGCKVHIHGHTHQSLDYTKEGINILCNPLGYPSDGTYNFIKQIEV